jgi:hypothetical protein
MITLAEDALPTAIVRMKKNTMNIAAPVHPHKVVFPEEMDVRALHQPGSRGQWEKVPGQPCQSKMVVVEFQFERSR